MTHSDLLYQLDISTFYFYEQLLFQIFNSWKFYKNLAFPLSTIFFTIYFHTFTVNSHVDKHSINIFICFKYDTAWNLSFIKICIKVLIKVFSIQIWFKSETLLLFFLIRTMVYWKKV